MASQPKRAAMEHMRCRIEEASETVRVTRDARVAAAAVLAKADEAAVAAEAHKACLVRDLNALILQSSVQQFKHLESLQERMDSLSVRVGGEAARKPSAAQTFAAPSSPGAASTPAASSAYKAARAEMEAAAAVTNSLAEAERATEAAAEAAVAARAKQAEAERWQAAARAAHVQLPARPQARASATGPRLIGTLPPAPPPPPGALPPAPSPPGRHNTSPFLPPARAAPAAVAQFAGFDS